ncbi:SHPS1 phosphatase, partial [Ramphastos sulfuratus]|nr:SHPS1 phosphatase [Ramphastos sulfuratus]
GAQKKWSFRLQQPQEQLWVALGQILTLTCTTSGDAPPGPVKWLKGWGSENQTIYDQTSPSPRVTRLVNGSNTDFSIHIRDVQPEDAGTYYCVKFRRSVGRGIEIFQHGKGTVVSVHDTTMVPGIVAAAVVPFLLVLLLFGLLVALCMYRRKRRKEAGSQRLSRACCAETPSTTRLVPTTSALHWCPVPLQHSKEDTTIHYADLQPLPTAPWHGRSPGTTCSEYASVRVAAK